MIMYNLHAGFPTVGIFFGFHAVGAAFILIGLLLLLRHAFKSFTARQLQKWGWSLLLIGILLCILAAAASPFGFRQRFFDSPISGMMNGNRMNRMMDRDVGTGMSMDEMTTSLEGKTGDDFDKAFLDEMIVHHQGAIDMANAAKDAAKHDEIKAMADAIITAQQKEIDQMKQWQQQWGYSR